MRVELRGHIFLALIASHSIFSQGNPPLSPILPEALDQPDSAASGNGWEKAEKGAQTEEIRVNQTRWGCEDWLRGLVTLPLAQQMRLCSFPTSRFILFRETEGRIRARPLHCLQGLGQK